MTKKFRLGAHYSLILGMYFMNYCAIYTFALPFFTSRNLADYFPYLIGGLNIFIVFFQTGVASFLNKKPHIKLHKICSLFLLITAIAAAIQIFLGNYPILTCLIFVVEFVFMLGTQSFLNSMCFEKSRYENEKINFGIARGIGSAFFAIMSLLIGYLVSNRAPYHLWIPILVVIISSMGMFLVIGFKIPSERTVQIKKASSISLWAYTKKNKRFICFLIGCIFAYLNHSLTTIYMSSIVVYLNGNTQDYGIIAAISGIVEVPAMFLLYFFIRKLGIKRIMIISFLAFLLKTGLMLLATSAKDIYYIHLLQFAGFAFFYPGLIYYVDKISERSERVRAQALAISSISIASAISSFLGGYIVKTFSIPILMYVGLVSGTIGLVIAILSIDYKKV